MSQASTFERYQQLVDGHRQPLGMQLPQLQQAHLTLRGAQGDFAAVHQAIDAFAAQYGIQAGWVMLGDQVVLTTTAPESHELLQAQYTDGNNSLHIQHLAMGQYQLTWFELDSCAAVTGKNYCYREQVLVLRPNLAHSHSTVRFWFEEVDHRWQPVAQQFIGTHNLQGVSA